MNNFISQLLAAFSTQLHRIDRTLLKVIAHKAVSVDALAQPLIEKRLVIRHRPGRSEARVRKRRSKAYPLMIKPKQLQTA
ncbi:MAG: hypothetical protein V7K85_34585 [Nostoc sp.]